MINTFRVQNYKALRDVTLKLTPIHLLIGPNDSGKTSLLEAVAALCRSANSSLETAFPGRWDGRDLVTERQPMPPVSFDCAIDSPRRAEYHLSVAFPKNGRNVLLDHEEAQFPEQMYQYSFPENNYSRSFVQMVSESGQEAFNHVRSVKTGVFNAGDYVEAFKCVYNAIHGVELYRWNARLLATPTALDPKAGFRMQASGFGLARVLDAILSYDRDLFMKLEQRFKEFFPDVSAIRLRSTDAYSTPSSLDELVPKLNESPGKEIAVQFNSSSADLPASQLSEGMLLILGYLAVMNSPEPPRVLLIEEPENGLHPDRLKDVISMLRQLINSQNHTQVILTSHSPYIVSLFQPEEVTLCRKNAEGYVEVKRLSDSELVKQQLDVFSLGEIWPAEEDEIFAESATEPVTEAPQ